MNSNTELIYILTYDCNFRCRYCDVGKRKEHMSKEIIQQSFRFIDSLPESININKVKFFGGEPLLRKSEMELVLEHFPEKHHPRFFVTTNTSLLDDDFMKMAEKQELTITCSIDGDVVTISTGRSRDSLEIAQKVVNQVKKYASQIRVNQVVTSWNADRFFENFRFIYNLWVRRFNFLPDYYHTWSKEGLKNLKQGFDAILRFREEWHEFELVNLENYSETSFFNLGIVIDTDGSIYGTNLILSKVFEKYKKDLSIGTVFDGVIPDFFSIDFQAWYIQKIQTAIEQEYSSQILHSVHHVDTLLNYFCYHFTKK